MQKIITLLYCSKLCDSPGKHQSQRQENMYNHTIVTWGGGKGARVRRYFCTCPLDYAKWAKLCGQLNSSWARCSNGRPLEEEEEEDYSDMCKLCIMQKWNSLRYYCPKKVFYLGLYFILLNLNLGLEESRNFPSYILVCNSNLFSKLLKC
jgi:hypothetical protein